jgi:hypothetical protein
MTKRGAKIVEPTPEQLSRGGYKRGFIMHTESATETMAFRSNHDPVERWKAADRLELHQIAAIELCQRLWHIAGLPIKVTGNYGERIPVTGSSELMNLSQIQAREDLYRIMDYFTGLEKWWNVFEQVCRHGEPAGVAGSRLGYGDRAGADRAHTVVCFIADKIAEQERL